MMNEVSRKWLAPAKLNLFLHVLGRRPDGLHELQTVFQLLDYGDELEFITDESGAIQRKTELADVPEESDLVVRAAKCLREAAGRPELGVTISCHKKIPMGGGLGGGSSDAATTLRALNVLWKLDFSTEELAKIGLELGADVPVFVYGHSAWAEGVGERLQAVELPNDWYLVVTPDEHVSTQAVFSHSDLTRDTKPIKIRDFSAGVGRNDCEPVVRQLFPKVAKCLDWLSQFGQARLTGTGASGFVAFKRRTDAENALNQLPGEWKGFVAQGINCIPGM